MVSEPVAVFDKQKPDRNENKKMILYGVCWIHAVKAEGICIQLMDHTKEKQSGHKDQTIPVQN